MTVSTATYDLVLMLDPEIEETTRARIVADARAAIEAQGKLLRHDEWGSRALAYPIERRTVAVYHLLQFHSDTPELLGGLNRSLRITDGVLRFRVIKLKPGVPDPPDMRSTPTTGSTAAHASAGASPSPPAGEQAPGADSPSGGDSPASTGADQPASGDPGASASADQPASGDPGASASAGQPSGADPGASATGVRSGTVDPPAPTADASSSASAPQGEPRGTSVLEASEPV